MPLKLSANLNMLFKEAGSLVERFQAAKTAGFSAVEVSFPYEFSVEKVASAKKEADVDIVLINGHPGKGWEPAKMPTCDMGIAAIPHRVSEFSEKLELSIKYAKALGCPRIHIMSGCRPARIIDTGMEDCYIENLTLAADRLQQEGIMCLIEPINPYSIPTYFMNSPSHALKIIKKINHPNLKMQLDLYHLQMIEGCLTKRIDEYLPYTGHIQIAQAPDRHEPDTYGEVNYKYVVEHLEKAGYDGYVGLEYVPKGNTVDGLKWINEMGLSLK
ncbi:putative hydroxypyruvate isomerase [Lineus longissimus]|uniref:putative hydroxypyruvate isomerase n=1 Tax=Lineus longissimus TaxID=88925 RepID=UPI002B4C87EF